MKFKIEVKEVTGEKSWWEDFDHHEVRNKEQAEQWGRETIQRFNRTLHHEEEPRHFLAAEITSEGTREHQWGKTNLVTIIKGSQVYDTMQCRLCGCTGKRHGLSEHITIDPKFHAKKWDVCPGPKKAKQS